MTKTEFRNLKIGDTVIATPGNYESWMKDRLIVNDINLKESLIFISNDPYRAGFGYEDLNIYKRISLPDYLKSI